MSYGEGMESNVRLFRMPHRRVQVLLYVWKASAIPQRLLFDFSCLTRFSRPTLRHT